MADLSITAAQVLSEDPVGTENMTNTKTGLATEAITTGQACYMDSNDVSLSKNDGTTAQAAFKGIALNTAGAGQPVTLKTDNRLTLGAGASPTLAETYAVSSTAGGICPIADVLTGDAVIIIGLGCGTDGIDIGATSGYSFA